MHVLEIFPPSGQCSWGRVQTQVTLTRIKLLLMMSLHANALPEIVDILVSKKMTVYLKYTIYTYEI